MAGTHIELGRLKNRAEFLRLSAGPWRARGGLVVQASPNPGPSGGPNSGDGIRIGITASKKIGNAVARNRAKRRLRSLAREVLPVAGRPGYDYVLVARAPKADKPGTLDRDFADLRSDLAQALLTLHA